MVIKTDINPQRIFWLLKAFSKSKKNKNNNRKNDTTPLLKKSVFNKLRCSINSPKAPPIIEKTI